jgi:hypothetical protein
MNNIVFNTVAQELRTSIYAQSPDTSLQSLQLDASNNLLVSVSNASLTLSGSVTITNPSLTVAGTVTVSEISAPVTVQGTITTQGTVTITNTSLTVAGTVTVSEISAPVTVSEISAPVTVQGSVTVANTSLTVAGTVTVSEISAPVTVQGTVTIGNASVTTTVVGYDFTTDTQDLSGVSGTGEVFDNTDISQTKTATFFVYNSGSSAITVSLQISPTTAATYYLNDPAYTDVAVGAGEGSIIVVGKFANYARLQYDAGATGTFTAYYNGQS